MTDPVLRSEAVAGGLADGRPVVALETSVISQGLPPPRGVECIERMNAAIAAHDALPAWIGVVGGRVTVGLTPEELQLFTEPDRSVKVARRDLPVAVATGALGATTVSAAIWAAHRAGIAVAATGGIGGVHPRSGDVSADLLELARTPVLLVCSGPKSIVDPLATAERLEELGVVLVGYRTDRLPFFLAAESEVELEHQAGSPEEAAGVARALGGLEVRSAVVLCNPVPPEHAMDAAQVAAAARACEERAAREGVRGKDVTPFLLACMAERTFGASLEANLALLESNAALAAEVAVALANATT